ncbi:MAG: MBL fold metallo-hydrolase, partial [Spirochaetia bacterium]|nr:MBL fold metallo-hydrolase [Spirochaetia bacterium]
MAKLQIEQLGAQTYYIPAPTNIGIFVENGKALLIDSGNDKEAGRQINKLLNERGWELSMIINTHSNADHIGGNQFL